MAKKKTLEEIRASQRARAARWREKNARTHRERVAEVYGRSHAQKQFEWGVTPQEVERYRRKVEEVHYGDIEGVDVPYGKMEPDRRGGHGGYKSMGQIDERGVGAEDGGGRVSSGVEGPEEETANGARAYARLAQLRARQAEGRLNAGVALSGPVRSAVEGVEGVEVDLIL